MAAAGRTHLVDVDLHEMLNSAEQLLPYLEPQWHHLITDYGWNTFDATNAGFPWREDATGGTVPSWTAAPTSEPRCPAAPDAIRVRMYPVRVEDGQV